MGDTWPYGPPLRYGYNELYASIIRQNKSAIEADILAAIALAESGGDIRVINDTPSTGDYSVGAWQINYLGALWAERTALFGTPQQLIASGIDGQARAATVIASGGFTPWSTYNSGAYRQFLNGAGTAPPQTGPGGTGSLGTQVTVQEGSSGPAVQQLQSDLDRLGYNLAVDGQFGPLTLAAVVNFQASHGLVQDGIVGPLTWGAIDAALTAASSPPVIPPGAIPPPEPPGNIDGATVAEWSNLVVATGPTLGGQLVTLNQWANSIGGLN